MSRRMLLVCSCVAAVLCRCAPAGPQAVSLLLDWTPNPDHVGLLLRPENRAVRQGRTRRDDPGALRPDRPAEAGRCRRHRPGGLLRAGAVLRRGKQAAGHRRRRDRPEPLDSIMAIEPAIRTRSPTSRAGRSASPASPRTTPTSTPRSPRSGSPARMSRSSRSGTTCYRRCSPTESTPSSASTATSRGSRSPTRTSTRRSSRSTERASRLRRARARGELDPAAHRPELRDHRAALRRRVPRRHGRGTRPPGRALAIL